MDDEIIKTLLKKATGYTFDEVQEEFACTPEGDTVLTKRKVTRKYYPPDSAALKAYLELAGGAELSELDDEALEAEKNRLLRELRQSEDAVDAKNKKCGADKARQGEVNDKI